MLLVDDCGTKYEMIPLSWRSPIHFVLPPAEGAKDNFSREDFSFNKRAHNTLQAFPRRLPNMPPQHASPELDCVQRDADYTSHADQEIETHPQHKLMKDLIASVTSLGVSINHLQLQNGSLQTTLKKTSLRLRDKIKFSQTERINDLIESVDYLRDFVGEFHNDNYNRQSFLLHLNEENRPPALFPDPSFPQFIRLPKELRK